MPTDLAKELFATATLINEVASLSYQAGALYGQPVGQPVADNPDKPTRTELLAENARLTIELNGQTERARLLLDAKEHWLGRAQGFEREIYELREVIRRHCMEEGDPICPKCGCDEIHHGSVSAADSNLGDTSWKECDECGHQWDIG